MLEIDLPCCGLLATDRKISVLPVEPSYTFRLRIIRHGEECREFPEKDMKPISDALLNASLKAASDAGDCAP